MTVHTHWNSPHTIHARKRAAIKAWQRSEHRRLDSAWGCAQQGSGVRTPVQARRGVVRRMCQVLLDGCGRGDQPHQHRGTGLVAVGQLAEQGLPQADLYAIVGMIEGRVAPGIHRVHMPTTMVVVTAVQVQMRAEQLDTEQRRGQQGQQARSSASQSMIQAHGRPFILQPVGRRKRAARRPRISLSGSPMADRRPHLARAPRSAAPAQPQNPVPRTWSSDAEIPAGQNGVEYVYNMAYIPSLQEQRRVPAAHADRCMLVSSPGKRAFNPCKQSGGATHEKTHADIDCGGFRL